MYCRQNRPGRSGDGTPSTYCAGSNCSAARMGDAIAQTLCGKKELNFLCYSTHGQMQVFLVYYQ